MPPTSSSKRTPSRTTSAAHPASGASGVSGAPRADFDPADDHTALYLALVEAPSVTRDELVVRGFDAEYVERVMDSFVHRGLARQSAVGAWEATPPDIALPAFASRLEEYASTIRASTAAITRTYASRLGDKPAPSGYDRLAGEEEIGAASQQVMALASERVIGVRKDTAYTRYLFDRPMDIHRKPLRNERGVALEVRLTLETATLRYPRAAEVLPAHLRSGEQHRYLPFLPFSALVNDRGMAVVDIDGPNGEALGLLISTPEATLAIDNAVQWAWRQASPWQIGDTGHTLEPRDRRVLELLAAGATDSTIARRLGVSQRTVERRVRDLMQRVGAETRFQAGVLAAKSGLI